MQWGHVSRPASRWCQSCRNSGRGRELPTTTEQEERPKNKEEWNSNNRERAEAWFTSHVRKTQGKHDVRRRQRQPNTNKKARDELCSSSVKAEERLAWRKAGLIPPVFDVLWATAATALHDIHDVATSAEKILPQRKADGGGAGWERSVATLWTDGSGDPEPC